MLGLAVNTFSNPCDEAGADLGEEDCRAIQESVLPAGNGEISKYYDSCPKVVSRLFWMPC
jgi:hypothetical protein